MNSPVHHETVIFTGHVQGVGFRYAALQVAKEFEIAGYVLNLSDGRVQVEAEGAKGEVKAYVEALHERMHGYVKSSERLQTSRVPQFSGFEIR